MDGNDFLRATREDLERRPRQYDRPGISSENAITMLLGVAFCCVRSEHEEDWEEFLLPEPDPETEA